MSRNDKPKLSALMKESQHTVQAMLELMHNFVQERVQSYPRVVRDIYPEICEANPPEDLEHDPGELVADQILWNTRINMASYFLHTMPRGALDFMQAAIDRRRAVFEQGEGDGSLPPPRERLAQIEAMIQADVECLDTHALLREMKDLKAELDRES